jgi:hypothetical protein
VIRWLLTYRLSFKLPLFTTNWNIHPTKENELSLSNFVEQMDQKNGYNESDLNSLKEYAQIGGR